MIDTDFERLGERWTHHSEYIRAFAIRPSHHKGASMSSGHTHEITVPVPMSASERDGLIVVKLGEMDHREWVAVMRYFAPHLSAVSPDLFVELVGHRAEMVIRKFNDERTVGGAIASVNSVMPGVLKAIGAKIVLA